MLNKKRHSTHSKSKFKTHTRAQEEITCNEVWYGDQPPVLGPSFTAAKTQERATTVTGILLRAAKKAEKKGSTDLAGEYYQLLDKIEGCRRGSRCGSLACPRCARAFQKAKIAAQQAVITQTSKARSGKQLVFVTLVPKSMMYGPGTLNRIEIKKANRWLKDTLKQIGNRTTLGSADLGWETRRGEGYIQIHWHLAMWTGNIGNLERKPKPIFRKTKKHERPVDVREAVDLGFLPYMNKAIKLPSLLRTNRTHLPEVMLVLDRTEPMDLVVHTKLRLSAQNGQLAFKPIGRIEG
jgi:hypothetical protein